MWKRVERKSEGEWKEWESGGEGERAEGRGEKGEGCRVEERVEGSEYKGVNRRKCIV